MKAFNTSVIFNAALIVFLGKLWANVSAENIYFLTIFFFLSTLMIRLQKQSDLLQSLKKQVCVSVYESIYIHLYIKEKEK